MRVMVKYPEELNWEKGAARIQSLGEEEISDIILKLCEGSETDGVIIAEKIRHGTADFAYRAVEGARIGLMFALERWQELIEEGELPRDLIEVEYHPIGGGWIDDAPSRMFALDQAGALSAMGCTVTYR